MNVYTSGDRLITRLNLSATQEAWISFVIRSTACSFVIVPMCLLCLR